MDLNEQAEAIRKMLGASKVEVARLGFDGDPQVRFTWPHGGGEWHFEMPSAGHFWDALVRLATKRTKENRHDHTAGTGGTDVTVYTNAEDIEVDGEKWMIHGVRNDGYVWGVATRYGETRDGYEGLQIDLSAVDPDDEAYDWEDDDLLLLIAQVAPEQIRAAK